VKVRDTAAISKKKSTKNHEGKKIRKIDKFREIAMVNSGLIWNTNKFNVDFFENNISFIYVLMISQKVDIESLKRKAIDHLMRTKIDHDEIIPDDSLEMITLKRTKW